MSSRLNQSARHAWQCLVALTLLGCAEGGEQDLDTTAAAVQDHDETAAQAATSCPSTLGDAGTPDAQTSLPGPGVDGAWAVEDRGVTCPRPALPEPGRLPRIEKHPDPFLRPDGKRIETRAEWTCQRAQLKAQVEAYQAGPKPAVSKEQVSSRWSGNELTVTVREGGRSVSFALRIDRPAGAPNRPIPLVLGFSNLGSFSLDASVFSQNGVATAAYLTNQFGDQSGAGSRGKGLFYDLYGQSHPAGSMVAWAWGVSRIIDALEKTPEANIDTRRIAVTGCSRYGKGALTAGALDERIALTIPQESGAGGSASWRVSEADAARGVKVQTLSNAAGEQPWFRADFARSFGGANVARLPFDQHTVMGLVAPRPLLVLDNSIDWLGTDSSYTSGLIASRIWKALGRSDAMGYWQTRGHAHCEFPAEQRAVLDAYVKRFLRDDETAKTAVLRADAAKADLPRWLDWEAPTLR